VEGWGGHDIHNLYKRTDSDLEGGGNTAVAAREVTEVGFNANKSVG